jgi:hypothetical protein
MRDSRASLFYVHSIVSLNDQPPHKTDNAKTTFAILFFAFLCLQRSGCGPGGFERGGQRSTMVLYSVQYTCLAKDERILLK